MPPAPRERRYSRRMSDPAIAVSGARPVEPQPLAAAVETTDGAPAALLALGIPRCGACELLPASLGVVAASRPDLVVGFGLLSGPEEWAARADLLWPRGIRVARASVPAMAFLVDGVARARRHGGGPAYLIDEWLTPLIGPPRVPVPRREVTLEIEALERTNGLRAKQAYVKFRARD